MNTSLNEYVTWLIEYLYFCLSWFVVIIFNGKHFQALGHFWIKD